MAKQILQRYGTAAQLATTAGTNREIALEVDGSGVATGGVRVMDGVTNGGIIHKPFPQTGTVLQTVGDATSTVVSWTKDIGEVYLGLQVAITPTSEITKIFAICTITCAGDGRISFFLKSSDTGGDLSGTVVGQMFTSPNNTGPSGLESASVSAYFTSGTTSQIYIKLIGVKHDSGTGYINRYGTECRMTLMEIA